MTHALARQFLLWSLAFNYAVLLVWFFAFIFARDGLRRLHGKWFRLSDSAFDAIHYGGMAAYKIGILLFNLAPFVALCIVGNGG
jgi:NO-binding membrane sensor protein with MHYT domain